MLEASANIILSGIRGFNRRYLRVVLHHHCHLLTGDGAFRRTAASDALRDAVFHGHLDAWQTVAPCWNIGELLAMYPLTSAPDNLPSAVMNVPPAKDALTSISATISFVAVVAVEALVAACVSPPQRAKTRSCNRGMSG